jgi:hypothetical protein
MPDHFNVWFSCTGSLARGIAVNPCSLSNLRKPLKTLHKNTRQVCRLILRSAHTQTMSVQPHLDCAGINPSHSHLCALKLAQLAPKGMGYAYGMDEV